MFAQGLDRDSVPFVSGGSKETFWALEEAKVKGAPTGLLSLSMPLWEENVGDSELSSWADTPTVSCSG